MATQKERRAAPRKPATKAEAKSAARPGEETQRRIAETAYFKAKARGFAPGHELEDWVQAEAEVRRQASK